MIWRISPAGSVPSVLLIIVTLQLRALGAPRQLTDDQLVVYHITLVTGHCVPIRMIAKHNGSMGDMEEIAQSLRQLGLTVERVHIGAATDLPLTAIAITIGADGKPMVVQRSTAGVLEHAYLQGPTRLDDGYLCGFLPRDMVIIRGGVRATFFEAGLVPEVSTVNFGVISEGQVIVREVKLKNATQNVIRIRQVRVSCGCAEASVDCDRVLPGENVVLTVKYDSVGQSGLVEDFCTVRTDEDVTVVRLTGIVHAQSNCWPRLLDFGAVTDKPVSKEVRILVRNGCAAGAVVGVEADKGISTRVFRSYSKLWSLPEDVIEVSLDPKALPSGQVQAGVCIWLRAPGPGTDREELWVPVRAFVHREPIDAAILLVPRLRDLRIGVRTRSRLVDEMAATIAAVDLRPAGAGGATASLTRDGYIVVQAQPAGLPYAGQPLEVQIKLQGHDGRTATIKRYIVIVEAGGD